MTNHDPSTSQMSCADAIEVVAGWQGRRIWVEIFDWSSGACLALIAGELQIVPSLSDRDADEPAAFWVGEQGHAGFNIEPPAFNGAWAGNDSLTLRLGHALIELSLPARADRHR